MVNHVILAIFAVKCNLTSITIDDLVWFVIYNNTTRTLWLRSLPVLTVVADLFTVSTFTDYFKEIRTEEVSRSTDKKKPHVIMEK